MEKLAADVSLLRSKNKDLQAAINDKKKKRKRNKKMPNPYNPEGASNGILSTFWSPNKITRSLELIAAAKAQAK